MATIGTKQLDQSVFELFDGIRSYDAKRAAAVLADDADFVSPWSHGQLRGKAKIEEHLKAWLGDAKTRPSLAIKDVSGDGSVTRLTVSISGRFGQKAQLHSFDVLCLRHVVHQVNIRPLGGDAGH